MVGKNPRPQLLGAVSGPIDTETHIIGVGRKRVAPYVPEPDLCQKCSKWGHKSWRCRTTYVRCRYCAGGHLSEECWEKIQQKVAVPPKCCNCGGQHNASSPVCPKKPRYKTLPPSIPSIPTTVYQTAPPPTRTAWNVTAMQEEFPPLQQEKATTNSTTKVRSLSVTQSNKVNIVAKEQERQSIAVDRLNTLLNESIEELRADRVRLERKMKEYTDSKFKEVQELVHQNIQKVQQEVQEFVQQDIQKVHHELQETVYQGIQKVHQEVKETVHQEIQKANCQQAKNMESIMEKLEILKKRDKERHENYEQLSRNIELILEKFEAFRREVLASQNNKQWPPPK
ncbi:uncharacterized protein LOC143037565 isoform X1 [Oratosquilla oratoria]|uniref:uncharacterized protein LOC143037565 isoform X1 n=1 Tax=Oratosquilla oratoria TaxID=337810 RepID=UPI003F762038